MNRAILLLLLVSTTASIKSGGKLDAMKEKGRQPQAKFERLQEQPIQKWQAKLYPLAENYKNENNSDDTEENSPNNAEPIIRVLETYEQSSQSDLNALINPLQSPNEPQKVVYLFHLAARKNNKPLLRYLLKAQVDPTQKDQNGQSASQVYYTVVHAENHTPIIEELSLLCDIQDLAILKPSRQYLRGNNSSSSSKPGFLSLFAYCKDKSSS